MTPLGQNTHTMPKMVTNIETFNSPPAQASAWGEANYHLCMMPAEAYSKQRDNLIQRVSQGQGRQEGRRAGACLGQGF